MAINAAKNLLLKFDILIFSFYNNIPVKLLPVPGVPKNPQTWLAGLAGFLVLFILSKLFYQIFVE
jgi:hypothetical protein